jgi:hypothetical protein
MIAALSAAASRLLDLSLLLGAAVGFFVFVQGVRFFLLVHAALRLRVQEGHHHLVPESEVPSHLREGLQAPIAELARHGFVFAGWSQGRRYSRSRADAMWTGLLVHPDEQAWVRVSFAASPEVLQPFSFIFHSFAAEQSVYTLNCGKHGMLGDFPRTSVVDPYSPTLEGQWRAHQAEVKRLGGTLLPEWLAPATEAQRLARHTVLLARRAERAVKSPGTGSLLATMLWTRLTGAKRQAFDFRRERNDRARATLAAAKEPVDAQAAALYFQGTDFQDPKAAEDARRALDQRMGATHDQRSRLLGMSAVDGARVDLAGLSASPSRWRASCLNS